jgi:hypothetical protein
MVEKHGGTSPATTDRRRDRHGHAPSLAGFAAKRDRGHRLYRARQRVVDRALVSFGFHPALKVTKITDESGKLLDRRALRRRHHPRHPGCALRQRPAKPSIGPSSTTAPSPATKTAPVEGLKLAAIQEPISYLLYPARWFPMTGYLTDRFTAEMHIRVPQGMRVFASGAPAPSKPVTLANGKPGDQYDFNWTKPGFPGTVIAGRFVTRFRRPGNVKVYLTVSHQARATSWRRPRPRSTTSSPTASAQPESSHLNVVELPDDTLPAVWAPELAAILGSRVGDKSGIRLLANTIAHQWWGSEVSPRTLNDAWITNGMSRYGELMYVEDESGKSALRAALQDVAAGALAYDTIPLSSAGRLDPFSPEFQSMTLEKGAMIFHMLRWESGRQGLSGHLKGRAQPVHRQLHAHGRLRKVAEAQSQQQLTPFFAQWIDGTGAPSSPTSTPSTGSATTRASAPSARSAGPRPLPHAGRAARRDRRQDRNQKIDVVGTDTQYVVDTFGRPRRISHRSRRLGAQVHARPAGAHRHPQGPATGGAGRPDRRAGRVPEGPRSQPAELAGQLPHRRTALYPAQLPGQRQLLPRRAARRRRAALDRGLEPHRLGKIFDITGQRDRAVNEYRLAVQTNDNTQGAVNEARQYLQKLSGHPVPQIKFIYAAPLQSLPAGFQCGLFVIAVSGTATPGDAMGIFCSLPEDPSSFIRTFCRLDRPPPP